MNDFYKLQEVWKDCKHEMFKWHLKYLTEAINFRNIQKIQKFNTIKSSQF